MGAMVKRALGYWKVIGEILFTAGATMDDPLGLVACTGGYLGAIAVYAVLVYLLVVFSYEIVAFCYQSEGGTLGLFKGLIAGAVWFAFLWGGLVPKVVDHYCEEVPIVEEVDDEEQVDEDPIDETSVDDEETSAPTDTLIGDCNIDEISFPCLFKIDENHDSAELIAKLFYDDWETANLIAALHRDKDGLIRRFDRDNVVLVPPTDSIISLEFYLDYLPLIREVNGITVEILSCSEDNSNKPCVYIVPVYMSKERIIETTYSVISAGRANYYFNRANKLDVVPDLGPFTIKLETPDFFDKGDIVILPSLP